MLKIVETKRFSDKNARASASQFFIAGELCRRGYVAVVTLGNAPNTDILCGNVEGTKFVHIQVKTFKPGDRTCTVGLKSTKNFGENFFWVLGGIPEEESNRPFEYYVIPDAIMAKNVSFGHQKWLDTPGKKGQQRNDNTVRSVFIPPAKSQYGWDISEYRDRWDLIKEKLSG